VCGFNIGSRFKVAALSPDGKFVLANSNDYDIQIFELDALITSSQYFHIGEKELIHTHLVVDAQFDPRGKRIATVCLDRKLRIWDLHSRRIDIEFGLAADPVGVGWSPSGRWIVVTMDSREIKAFFVGVFENSSQLLAIADAWLANNIDSAIAGCWKNW
jgi:WD40 repeat protein